jgi:cell division protein FtsB
MELLFAQRWVLLGGILVSGVILATLGDNRRELARLNAQRKSLALRVDTLTHELADANTEIILLQQDSRRLERDARERLLMGRAGEFLIPVHEPLYAVNHAQPSTADRRDP